MAGSGTADVEVRFKGEKLRFLWMQTDSQCGAVFRNPSGRKARDNSRDSSNGEIGRSAGS
jgi:hypothetical protein